MPTFNASLLFARRLASRWSLALPLVALAACARDHARTPSDSTRATRLDSTKAGIASASPAASVTVSAPARVDTSASSAPSASRGSAWTASVRGVGVVTFGTSLDSAARVAGGTVAHAPGGSCGFVSLRDVPHGARFMVSYDTVVRVDVDSALVPTEAGARVGMREDSVQRLYAGKLRMMPHKYVRGGHYLIFVPGAPADTMHQLIFETDGDHVTRYRAGLAPYVAYVEGCG